VTNCSNPETFFPSKVSLCTDIYASLPPRGGTTLCPLEGASLISFMFMCHRPWNFFVLKRTKVSSAL